MSRVTKPYGKQHVKDMWNFCMIKLERKTTLYRKATEERDILEIDKYVLTWAIRITVTNITFYFQKH